MSVCRWVDAGFFNEHSVNKILAYDRNEVISVQN